MKIALSVIVLALNSFADCGVGSIEDVNEVNAQLKEECENLLGGGGKYISSITLSTPSNTCDGIYVENAYVLTARYVRLRPSKGLSPSHRGFRQCRSSGG